MPHVTWVLKIINAKLPHQIQGLEKPAFSQSVRINKRGNSMICNECDNKGYTLEWNASFDGNIKVRCYSCLANEQHKNDVAKRLAKLFMESSPQKNAYYLADILVTASINKDELENIESFIESKSKDALYVLLNHVV